jgi:hypothetical protein
MTERYYICALTIQGGRIVSGEENLKNFPERYDARVKRYLDNFSVTCCSRANLLISRIYHPTTRVARFSF